MGATSGETRSLPGRVPGRLRQGRARRQDRRVHRHREASTSRASCRRSTTSSVAPSASARAASSSCAREVEENMRRELADNVRGRIKTQLLDKLLAPRTRSSCRRAAVENQVRALQIDWLRRIGARPEDLKQAPPREPFEAGGAPARRDRPADRRDHAPRGHRASTRPRLEERIESAAVGYSDPGRGGAPDPRQRRAARAARGARCSRTRRSTGCWRKVKVVEQPSTFKELMNFGA